jgi:hypothetical protein
MTTNIYDFHAGMIGCDSRWSIETPSKALIYVDDSGYEKIEQVGNHAFLFAGNVGVIHEWKLHLHRRHRGEASARPALAGIAVLAVELGTCLIVDGYGQDIQPVENGVKVASFAGTGSFHAHQCWRQNRCVKTAVGSAVLQDRLSGLPMKYLNLKDVSDADCVSQIDLKVLQNSFLTKGMVMKPSPISPPVPLKDAAMNDPEIKQYMDGIASGTVQVQAPCDAMFNEPTAADEQRIDAMLDKIFGA